MIKSNSKMMLKVAGFVMILLLSFFVAGRYVTSPDCLSKTIAVLDEEKTTVLELTATATAASAAITLLPGDTATPIAQKLADLSSYFLIVVSAILLEKYLLTVIGFITFRILIPIACVLMILYLIKKKASYKNRAIKLAVFGLVIFAVIPIGVWMSGLIQDTYNVSIENTIEATKQVTEEIEDSAESDEEGAVAGILSKIKDSVTGTALNLENILNNFVEALAVMIVTCCLIPIAVVVFIGLLIKNVFSTNGVWIDEKKLAALLKDERFSK